ncbi:DUF6349 family protein [Sphaerisporangium sp. NPDC051011]|uniref:DUF6349 family protein n=1 Tax=Sphaerisporangium sp. NPDC051011 TaxID=3155792 RepID=UPI0033FA1CB7
MTATEWNTWDARPDPAPEMSRTCRVYVQYRSVKNGEPAEPTVANPDRRLRYQSQCGGCGHQGPERSSENTAAEDGCDHAYPGWRDMPVMEHRPHEDKKAIARWEKEARAAYPAGWFDRQGPVREYRTPGGTRHVPGMGPGGGYCMAVLRTPPPKPRTPTRAVQQPLFG